MPLLIDPVVLVYVQRIQNSNCTILYTVIHTWRIMHFLNRKTCGRLSLLFLTAKLCLFSLKKKINKNNSWEKKKEMSFATVSSKEKDTKARWMTGLASQPLFFFVFSLVEQKMRFRVRITSQREKKIASFVFWLV